MQHQCGEAQREWASTLAWPSASLALSFVPFLGFLVPLAIWTLLDLARPTRPNSVFRFSLVLSCALDFRSCLLHRRKASQ